MCLQVAIAALYYDSNLFFETLSNSQNTLPGVNGDPAAIVRNFIEQWLHDTDCFIGALKKKIIIYSFALPILNFPSLDL